MSKYKKPWLALYGDKLPETICPAFQSALAMFKASVERSPDRALIHYFSSTLSVREVDDLSDALAVALQSLGVKQGDRVAVSMQNMPQFVLTMLATWKAGGILVPVNPMLTQRELNNILQDSGAVVLITLESLYQSVAADVIPATSVRTVITTSELDFLEQIPGMLEGVVRQPCEGVADFLELLDKYRGRKPDQAGLTADDLAFLTYTSGTTGMPKAAMNTHGNVVAISEMLRDWIGLGDKDVILALAPLFHITGLVVHVTLSFALPSPLVLFYRFDPETAAQMIERYQVTYTAGAITAFIALMNSPEVEKYDMSSLQKVHSGGAPNPPATVAAFEKKFGVYLHGAYGLTESTAPTHYVPFGMRAPVDPESGVLSVGIPVCGVTARVVDDEGNELPPNEVGELLVHSPGVVPGYWHKSKETEQAIQDGELRTGDVGFMDEKGWFYLVDRKKDVIIASGFKVWPREVEDVLYQYPAVLEAAVIGVPDKYRGETVKAYVSLKTGESATQTQLIDHCREMLSAYKRPRFIEIVEQLPKNPSGKILRRELRDRQVLQIDS